MDINLFLLFFFGIIVYTILSPQWISNVEMNKTTTFFLLLLFFCFVFYCFMGQVLDKYTTNNDKRTIKNEIEPFQIGGKSSQYAYFDGSKSYISFPTLKPSEYRSDAYFREYRLQSEMNFLTNSDFHDGFSSWRHYDKSVFYPVDTHHKFPRIETTLPLAGIEQSFQPETTNQTFILSIMIKYVEGNNLFGFHANGRSSREYRLDKQGSWKGGANVRIPDSNWHLLEYKFTLTDDSPNRVILQPGKHEQERSVFAIQYCILEEYDLYMTRYADANIVNLMHNPISFGVELDICPPAKLQQKPNRKGLQTLWNVGDSQLFLTKDYRLGYRLGKKIPNEYISFQLRGNQGNERVSIKLYYPNKVIDLFTNIQLSKKPVSYHIPSRLNGELPVRMDFITRKAPGPRDVILVNGSLKVNGKEQWVPNQLGGPVYNKFKTKNDKTRKGAIERGMLAWGFSTYSVFFKNLPDLSYQKDEPVREITQFRPQWNQWNTIRFHVHQGQITLFVGNQKIHSTKYHGMIHLTDTHYIGACCSPLMQFFHGFIRNYKLWLPMTSTQNMTSGNTRWLNLYYPLNHFKKGTQVGEKMVENKAIPTISYSKQHTNRFLPGWTPDGKNSYGTLQLAKDACTKWGKSCGGVTKQGKVYTTRSGSQLRKSPSQEISWKKVKDISNDEKQFGISHHVDFLTKRTFPMVEDYQVYKPRNDRQLEVPTNYQYQDSTALALLRSHPNPPRYNIDDAYFIQVGENKNQPGLSVPTIERQLHAFTISFYYKHQNQSQDKFTLWSHPVIPSSSNQEQDDLESDYQHFSHISVISEGNNNYVLIRSLYDRKTYIYDMNKNPKARTILDPNSWSHLVVTMDPSQETQVEAFVDLEPLQLFKKQEIEFAWKSFLFDGNMDKMYQNITGDNEKDLYLSFMPKKEITDTTMLQRFGCLTTRRISIPTQTQGLFYHIQLWNTKISYAWWKQNIGKKPQLNDPNLILFSTPMKEDMPYYLIYYLGRHHSSGKGIRAKYSLSVKQTKTFQKVGKQWKDQLGLPVPLSINNHESIQSDGKNAFRVRGGFIHRGADGYSIYPLSKKQPVRLSSSVSNKNIKWGIVLCRGQTVLHTVHSLDGKDAITVELKDHIIQPETDKEKKETTSRQEEEDYDPKWYGTIQPRPPFLQNNLSPEGWKTRRLENVLYSGDLIHLTSEGRDKYIQRMPTDSTIIFGSRIPYYGSNLSKLRFERIDHNPLQFQPLQYNQPVVIKHNSYHQNRNYPYFIKHGNELHSHQEGPLYTRYRILPAEEDDSKYGKYIRLNEPIILAVDQYNQTDYIQQKAQSGVVGARGTKETASPLYVEFVSPVEMGDQHLLIREGDKLFP